MKKRGVVLLTFVTAVVATLGAFTSQVLAAGRHAGPSHAVARVHGHGGLRGVVHFARKHSVVEVRVRLEGMEPGFHSIHVHSMGACPGSGDPGGHLNPARVPHPNHPGDLPVLLATSAGTVEMEVVTDRFTVRDLLDADGSAVVIHESPDNFANIPARYHSHQFDTMGPDALTLDKGDAGHHLGCGVVARK